jgi:hypothetical protein
MNSGSRDSQGFASMMGTIIRDMEKYLENDLNIEKVFV